MSLILFKIYPSGGAASALMQLQRAVGKLTLAHQYMLRAAIQEQDAGEVVRSRKAREDACALIEALSDLGSVELFLFNWATEKKESAGQVGVADLDLSPGSVIKRDRAGLVCSRPPEFLVWKRGDLPTAKAFTPCNRLIYACPHHLSELVAASCKDSSSGIVEVRHNEAACAGTLCEWGSR